MTKADKQIIETLQNIQEYCQNMNGCKLCKFAIIDSDCKRHCQVGQLNRLLVHSPDNWDMEEIERIITST